jgi:hypothetical protein
LQLSFQPGGWLFALGLLMTLAGSTLGAWRESPLQR